MSKANELNRDDVVKLIVIVIVIGVCCFGAGYTIGYGSGIEKCADIAFKIFKDAGYEFPKGILQEIINHYGESFLKQNRSL